MKFGALQIECNHWCLFHMEYTRLKGDVFLYHQSYFVRIIGSNQAHKCGRWDFTCMVFPVVISPGKGLSKWA